MPDANKDARYARFVRQSRTSKPAIRLGLVPVVGQRSKDAVKSSPGSGTDAVDISDEQ